MPEWVRRAEEAQRRSEGSWAKGKTKVMLHQNFSMCRPGHRMFRLNVEGAKIVCGTCHPPSTKLDVVWLDETEAS